MAGSRVRQTIRLIDSMLTVHIGAHEAAIDYEAFTTNQPLGNAARHHRLEQLAQLMMIDENVTPTGARPLPIVP
jgi:hypothetical protein